MWLRWCGSLNDHNQHLIQGSLNYPFEGDQTMQIYGNIEGIPLWKCIVWVGNNNDPCNITTLLVDPTKGMS